MSTDGEEDAFKNTFKYYKSKKPPPSLRDVIDFQNYKNDNNVEDITTTKAEKDVRCTSLGLTEVHSWKTYALKNHPGLFYITNPFTSKGQRHWIQRCLEDYPKKPNKTNLDSEIQLKDWWSYCHENIENSKKYLKKLRWTTLGYHHDWDTKVYTEDSRHQFPEDLAEMCDVVAKYLGYDKFSSQAAIVNYYHMDSTLSPHTDHSEINLDAPLISISFGQSAIFLIGGPEKAQKPSALRLNSGDIVVMSKESRLSYHAVPKILPATECPWIDVDYERRNSSKCSKNNNFEDIATKRNLDDLDWTLFESYVKHSRLNINVRQVLNENQTSLTNR